jgi:hypothetical protein
MRGVAPTRASAENWDYLLSGEPPLAVERTPEPVKGGVGLGFGLAFGGESLVTATLSDGTTDELNAGQGVLLTARAFLNPLWVSEVIGFGLGVEWGWKYTSISASNAGLSLTRFPFELMGRFLARFNGDCYLVLAGGLHNESGVRISGSGAFGGLEGKLDDALGPTGEVGVLFSSEHVGIDLTLRYTHLTYTVGSASGDASHVGLFTGIFYTF